MAARFRASIVLPRLYPPASATFKAAPLFKRICGPPVIRVQTYAKMSQSHACCTVPPVVADGYKEKGEWITINGMKTYATGLKDAKTALLVVYDIFGYVVEECRAWNKTCMPFHCARGTGWNLADILLLVDSPHRLFRGQISSLLVTRNDSTRCSCRISSMGSRLISRGTHRTLMRRARSWESSFR